MCPSSERLTIPACLMVSHFSIEMAWDALTHLAGISRIPGVDKLNTQTSHSIRLFAKLDSSIRFRMSGSGS
jgi:hypothetical protein